MQSDISSSGKSAIRSTIPHGSSEAISLERYQSKRKWHNRAGEKEESRGIEHKVPELVKVEVANLEGELVLVHDKPKDGSALEAASELHKLTEVLTEKAEELKVRADQAFIGHVVTEIDALPAANPDALDQLPLLTAVKEAVDDLRHKIALVAGTELEDSSHAVQHADVLDKVAEVLASHSEQLKEQKIDLAAKELNNLDGFDR